jgi:hypothetical protein
VAADLAKRSPEDHMQLGPLAGASACCGLRERFPFALTAAQPLGSLVRMLISFQTLVRGM